MAAIQRVLALRACEREREREREAERLQLRRPRSRLVAINARIRENFDPLEVYNDAAVLQRYRLPREAIRQLLGTISEDLRRATRRSFALTPQAQFLAALRFYATGSFLQVVGDGQGLSKASVSRSVQAVTYRLLQLVPQHVRFPTTREEMSATQEKFFRSFRIPQVAGAVDGTLVPIITPHVDAHVFFCRKGYAAVNCQVVCDHEGIILDVVARWPGSTHDSFVFRESSLGRLAAASRGEWRLLGDSGYPLRPYLFTPVANPGDVHQEDFNEAHRLARCVVERTIGRWKLRFRCLHKSGGGLQFSPAKSCAVICVTAMLHNIAAKAGAVIGEPEEEEDGDEEEPFQDDLPQNYVAGFESRRRVIETFF